MYRHIFAASFLCYSIDLVFGLGLHLYILVPRLVPYSVTIDLAEELVVSQVELEL